MDTDPHRKGPLADGPDADPGGSTLAQLKDDIDKGKTGQRARSGDPGLSMLGTDDEAGGAPQQPRVDRPDAPAGTGEPRGGDRLRRARRPTIRTRSPCRPRCC
jgi:hypothetical protein